MTDCSRRCYTYILLTKREVKMVGYRPSSLFVFLWTEANSLHTALSRSLPYNNNLLLTECEGRTGEYWPEVVAVRPVRTKTTEGQYSPVRLEQARLVSSLLYGTLSLIVKCTSGGLLLKMFVFSIYL